MKLRTLARQLILIAAMSTPAFVHAAPVVTPEPGGKTVELWPGGAPGSERVTVREELLERSPDGPLRDRIAQHVTRPLMTLFEPKGTYNGITLLVVPGGGYTRVVIDKEGFESAEWFAERGFAAAVLRYRMPADGWAAGADAPVHDAMRALRLLRARPSGEQPGRIGVIGFSAGGHVVARLITEPELSYPRLDSSDERSARPDFAVLMYPVIATTGPSAHAGSAEQLLNSGVLREDLVWYSPDRNVNAATPRTLLIHAADDTGVVPDNSRLMYEALRKAGVPTALRVFDHGGHGFGMRGVKGLDSAAWPELVESWAMNDAPPKR
jgi:acetyl esterase/lipase